jgi:glycosyltransferase involved in cell wall biosynthesis
MTPLRLLVISSGFPNEDGTVTLSVFVKQQIDALRKQLSEISVIAPYPYNNSLTARLTRLPPSRSVTDYSYDNVRVFFPRYIDAPWPVLDRLRGDVWHWLARRVIRRHALRFDIIHAHFTYPGGYVARMLARDASKPYVVTVHENSDWFNEELKAEKPRLLDVWRDASCVLTVNQVARAELLRFNRTVISVGNGYPDGQFQLGARGAARARLCMQADATILLCVADYTERKNQELVIRALAKLKNRGAHAYLVGRERGSLAELHRLSKNLGVSDRVHLVGPVPNEALGDYYVAADLLLLPSRSESFGVVQIEAMACGLPIVATATDGSREVIRTDQVGLIVETLDDAGEFAAAIEDALSRNWNRERIADYARRFSISSLADRVLDCYSNSIGH